MNDPMFSNYITLDNQKSKNNMALEYSFSHEQRMQMHQVSPKFKACSREQSDFDSGKRKRGQMSPVNGRNFTGGEEEMLPNEF